MDWEAYGVEQRSRWSQLVADVWDDPTLRKRLLEDPKSVLKERGIELKDGVEVKVLENTPTRSYLTIPQAPGSGALSDEDLEKVAGGRASKKKTAPACTCGAGPNASCSPSDPRGTIN